MQIYFCGFSRQKLRAFGLNNDDVAVLDYLQRFFSSCQAKYVINNDKKYWFITYRKIYEDAVTDWSIQTYKRRFAYYKTLQIIDIFKPIHNSTKLYVKLNLDFLYESDEFEESPGRDKTLQYYYPNGFYNSIKVGKTIFQYHSSVLKPFVINNFNARNQQYSTNKDPIFTNIFKTFLRKIVSKHVFDTYLSRCFIVLNNPNYVQINYTFASQKLILEKERYNIERALCDAFLFTLEVPSAVEKYYK